MKKLLTFIFLSFFGALSSQIKSNIISKMDFLEIKINNQSIYNIQSTKGDKTKIIDLFKVSPIVSEIDTDGEFLNYKFNGFRIGFSGLIGTIESPVISRFEINSPQWEVTILGKKFTVGAHFSNLGNVVINREINGNFIIFKYCEGCNNFISIELDSNDNIAKIIYVEPT